MNNKNNIDDYLPPRTKSLSKMDLKSMKSPLVAHLPKGVLLEGLLNNWAMDTKKGVALPFLMATTMKKAPTVANIFVQVQKISWYTESKGRDNTPIDWNGIKYHSLLFGNVVMV